MADDGHGQKVLVIGRDVEDLPSSLRPVGDIFELHFHAGENQEDVIVSARDDQWNLALTSWCSCTPEEIAKIMLLNALALPLPEDLRGKRVIHCSEDADCAYLFFDINHIPFTFAITSLRPVSVKD